MLVTIVVDNLKWGGAHAANAVRNLIHGSHTILVTDIDGFEHDASYSKSDLVFAWIDSSNPAVYEKRLKGFKFAFATRIPGWKSVYRAVRQPSQIKAVVKGVVACNDALAVAAKKIYPNALVQTIKNGVDAEQFYPALKRDGPCWGWVGRLHDEQKDVALMSEIRKAMPVKVMAQRWVEGKIVACDWPDEMRQWYQRLYGYFRTSRHEGSSNALLEACACGLPVVATPTGVAAEILCPEFLCTSEKHFLVTMRDLNQNPDKARIVGIENRKTVLASWQWKHRKHAYQEFMEACI